MPNSGDPFHLKVAAWRDNSIRAGHKLQFGLDEVKTVLMPRQGLFKKLDPLGTMLVPEVLNMLSPYVIKYQQLVLQDRPAADMDIKGALKIYKSFHQLTRKPTWGDVPIWCTCKVSFPNCVSRYTLFFASLFNPAIYVPADYIAATVSGCKRCKSIKGKALFP
jgi:hypothetical protein